MYDNNSTFEYRKRLNKKVMKNTEYKGFEIRSEKVRGCIKHFSTLPNGVEVNSYYKPEVKSRIDRFLEKGN